MTFNNPALGYIITLFLNSCLFNSKITRKYGEGERCMKNRSQAGMKQGCRGFMACVIHKAAQTTAET